MAQRVLNCPSCSARIEVPDNYFRANIACYQCGAQLDRRTGEMANTGHAAPPGQPVQQRAPANAYPAQYGAPPHYGVPQQYGAYPQYAQPSQYAQYRAQKSSKPTWLIVLLILIPVGVVGILALAAIPLITSGAVSDTGDWHRHRDEAGGYGIEFPRTPTTKTERVDTPLGKRSFHSSLCMAGLIYFEAAWYDLGPGPESNYVFDYHEGARGFAEKSGGRIARQRDYMVGRYTGSLAVIVESGDNNKSVMMVRRGNRVHIVVVENYSSDKQAVVDRFIGSFKLIQRDGESLVDTMAPYRKVGNTWTHRSEAYMEGMDSHFTTMRYEILEVTGDRARYRLKMELNNDFEIDPSETWIDLKPQSSGYDGAIPERTVSRDSVTVAAGTFDCDKSVTNYDGVEHATWICRRTGLVVLTESKNRERVQTRMELTAYDLK